MKISDLSEEMWALLFGVRRSARYHDRRVRFYDFMHTSATATALIFGSAAVAGVLSTNQNGDKVAVVSAALVSIFAAFDLVCGFSRKTWQHAELKRRFLLLEGKIIGNHDDDSLGCYQAERLTIEMDEPPVMRALDLLCHNELLRAEGLDGAEPIGFIKRNTAQLIAWG